ncbi:MAG: HPr family phosphocarrier protein [Pseudomonadota bacterium]
MSSDQSEIFKIPNKRGLHARASAKFVACVEKFDADVIVSKDGHVVGGTSIMGLMLLAANQGSSIHVTVTGPDSAEALQSLKELIDRKFGEAE